MNISKLAFRNIWRNRRRTLITAAAVAFAVFTASTMRSFQKGVWSKVIDGSVSQFFGYVQVHGKGFWNEQTLDKAFEYDDNLKETVFDHPAVVDVLPRIESFALASYGDLTKGVLVIGMAPEQENAMSDLSSKLIAGRMLDQGEKAALLASDLAEKLKISVGDSLILISQGYRGANAVGKYAVAGIIKFALPDLNKRLVYLPLATAQDFYAAPEMLTTLAFRVDDKKNTENLIQHLETVLDTSTYEVLSWQETIPELVDAKALDEAGGRLIFFLLYTLIAFGLFGTIMMMTKERSYEFGVLTAIGMRRNMLFATVWLEMVVIGFIGAIGGILMSIPVVYYLYTHPLDMTKISPKAGEAYEKFGIEPLLPAAFEPLVFLQQALIIFLITTVLAWYPLYKIRTLKPVEAMRE